MGVLESLGCVVFWGVWVFLGCSGVTVKGREFGGFGVFGGYG